jgi:protein-S-isoprenylcysteine O-methyltransferase Ste14
MDVIPIWLVFIVTALVIMMAIELGFRAGKTHDENTKNNKEKITTYNVAAILGLLTFVLVFTFGIVYSRYDSKKGLVREEANLIRTAWLRADFLPEQDRARTEVLLRKYIDLRLEAFHVKDLANMQAMLDESGQIQHQIWEMGVAYGRNNMNSEIAALYIASLNDMINQHSLRVAVGLQARIPTVMWVLLYMLIFLGMFGVGYQVSITGSSRRSWTTPVMILVFSLMILLITALDRPNNSVMPVSQQPLKDLRTWMDSRTHNQQM